MDVGDIRFYRERWKAVEEIERQELRAASIGAALETNQCHLAAGKGAGIFI